LPKQCSKDVEDYWLTDRYLINGTYNILQEQDLAGSMKESDYICIVYTLLQQRE